MAESKSNRSSKAVEEKDEDATTEKKTTRSSRKNNNNDTDRDEDKYEEIKQGQTHLSELQKMTVKELYETAKNEDIKDYTGLKKQDLIFKILG